MSIKTITSNSTSGVITSGYVTPADIATVSPYQTTTTTAVTINPYATTGDYTWATTDTGTALKSDTIHIYNPVEIKLEKDCSYNLSLDDVFKSILGICDRPDDIMKIEELKPLKVYRFTFGDGTVIKTICSDNDVFDLRYACFLALAKKLYSKIFTFEGVLQKTEELMYYKEHNKMVDKAIKDFYKEQEAKAKEEEAKRISKRKHDKLVARKIAKKERKRKEQVDIIAEAIRISKEEN